MRDGEPWQSVTWKRCNFRSRGMPRGAHATFRRHHFGLADVRADRAGMRNGLLMGERSESTRLPWVHEEWCVTWVTLGAVGARCSPCPLVYRRTRTRSRAEEEERAREGGECEGNRGKSAYIYTTLYTGSLYRLYPVSIPSAPSAFPRFSLLLFLTGELVHFFFAFYARSLHCSSNHIPFKVTRLRTSPRSIAITAPKRSRCRTVTKTDFFFSRRSEKCSPPDPVRARISSVEGAPVGE